MNFLSQILAFNDLLQIHKLSPGQIALWYALMHINNKCGWQEWFSVSIRTLEEQTGLARSGIKKAREVLRVRGLIDFKGRGRQATLYHIKPLYLIPPQIPPLLPNNCATNSSQSETLCALGCDTVSVQGSSQGRSQDRSQSSSPLYKQNKTKKIYILSRGTYENVLLSDDDMEKLKSEFPADYNERIERLSEYMASTGKKYKNHLATIRAWARKEKSAPASKDSNAGRNPAMKWYTEKEASAAEILGIGEENTKPPDWKIAGFSSAEEHRKFLEDFRR